MAGNAEGRVARESVVESYRDRVFGTGTFAWHLVCPTNPGLSLLAMACIFGPTACQYVLGRNMHSSFMRGRVIETFRMVCTPGM